MLESIFSSVRYRPYNVVPSTKVLAPNRMGYFDRFHSLSNFCGFFHEDWPVDHSSADDVLRFYISWVTAEDITNTARDINNIIIEINDDDELNRAIVFKLHCSYDAKSDGWSGCREWLEHVRDVLSDAIRS